MQCDMNSKSSKNTVLNLEKTTISRFEQKMINGGVNNLKTITPTEVGESCFCTWDNSFDK